MSVRTEQALRAAAEVMRQDARVVEAHRSASVINLRPLRGEVYDQSVEQLQLALDLWAWSLITITLRKSETQAGRELADLIEARLQHPSAAVPS